MRHLTPAEFVGIIDGVRDEPSAAHLAACEECANELAALRAAMEAAADIEVPEPSPLFWDHLSARVREAVAAEGVPRAGVWDRWLRWQTAVPAAAALAVVIMAAVAFKSGPAGPSSPQPAATSSSTPSVEVPPLGALGSTDDPTLALVADLAAGMEPEALSQAVPLAGAISSADEAVGALTSGELEELGRLLKAELAKPGA